MLTMDPKSWRLYALPLSVCSVVLDFPPLLLGCATTALILKLLWRSCLSLFSRTHKPCPSLCEGLTALPQACYSAHAPGALQKAPRWRGVAQLEPALFGTKKSAGRGRRTPPGG